MKTTVHNGKYRLIEKLGSGATSIVYKAARVSDGKIFAVKILRHEYVSDEESVKRFMREADALSKLNHQNVVNVYDFGNEEDTFYIVMEYIEGETLKRVIRSAGSLPEDTVIIIALQLCAALKQAHDNGIVHRDIKPQNILVTLEGTVKIADFGIARLNTQSTMTALGKDVLGSVHYISPEQARGGYLDKRSDIYSLGVTLYEMATGTLPYTGDDPLNVAMRHVNDTAIPAKEVNSNLSKALSNIIEKCMSKNADNRYNDVSDLKNDLLHSVDEPEGAYVKIYNEFDDESPTQNIKVNIPVFNEITEKDNMAIQKKETAEEENKKKIWKLAGLIALAIAVLVGVILLFIFIIGNWNKQGAIGVPRLIGITVDEATEILQDKNLRIETFLQYSEIVAENIIISQNPEEGTEVDPNTVVTVYVSRGKAQTTLPPTVIKMPDLLNKTKDDAIKAIEDLGLTVGIISEAESDKAINTVIDQKTPANTELQEDAVIDFTVSKGVEIPSITGLTLNDAETLLTEKGFELGIVNYIDREGKGGTIDSQTPAATKNYDISGGKPKIDITVIYYKQILDIDTMGFDSGILRVSYFEDAEEKIETEIELSPDTQPPSSIDVFSTVVGEREYIVSIDELILYKKTLIFS